MPAEKDYPSYFRKLATELNAIGHTPQAPKFGRIEFEEEHISIKSKGISTQSFCMFIGFPRASVQDGRTDNTHKYVNVLMYIVKQCKKDDFVQIDQTIKECEAVAMKVLGRIYKDKCDAVIQGFDRNNIAINEVLRYPDVQDFGVSVEFVLHNSIEPEMYFNPDDWTLTP
jgi:hypothetical protein